MKFLVFMSFMVVASHGQSAKRQRTFPADFLFGCASAAYQIEGAWDGDGKAENIWDHMTHNSPGSMKDLSNGDIACDSYHNYKRDVEMMRELGLNVYRFSLSWTRILPTGFSNVVNPAGIEYYNNLINEMLKYNIRPMVTLYHWDLPQSLQELGGFANPLIANWFEDYARVAFENFGDRVKYWITFNEPNSICANGYGSGLLAPMLNSTAFGTYLCAKYLVLAHASAYHLYKNDFKPTQEGQIGISIGVNKYLPYTDSAQDKFAAEIKNQGEWGLYADPLFSREGGFPKEFSERIAKKSIQQGFSKSRLPAFTEEERIRARGAVDFFGMNHYTSGLVSAKKFKTPVVVPSYEDDLDVGIYIPDDWPTSASFWMWKAPKSAYNSLVELKRRYKNPVIYITENGWSTTPDRGLIDDDRITYYRAALEDVLDALEHGVNIRGYIAWSMMDNFEWTAGYTERFGLYQVDFEDPARTRTPRKSAFVYKHIIGNRFIDHDYEPESMTMIIDGFLRYVTLRYVTVPRLFYLF